MPLTTSRNTIQIADGWLEDERISNPMRVLLAIEALKISGEEITHKDLQEITGLFPEQIRQALTRMRASGLLEADRIAVENRPRLSADRRRPLTAKTSEFRLDHYPEIYLWTPLFESLLADGSPVAWIANLEDPEVREYWRYFRWNCRKNIWLSKHFKSGQIREHAALVAVVILMEKNPEKFRWSTPRHGLSTLIASLAEKEVLAVREAAPELPAWIRMASEKKKESIHSRLEGIEKTFEKEE